MLSAGRKQEGAERKLFVRLEPVTKAQTSKMNAAFLSGHHGPSLGAVCLLAGLLSVILLRF